MKAYMAYERHGGPSEGAVLVFANSHREARRVAFPYIADWTDCRYIDVGARLLPSCSHPARKDVPHVLEPDACIRCEQWHDHPNDENGLCRDCAVDAAWDERDSLPTLTPTER